MEIRKILPQERIEASKIQSIAFQMGQDFSSEPPVPEKPIKSDETGRAAFNEQGKMCACLEHLPFKVRFDGKPVNMAGIGGVATLPEERNKGYIRELFKSSFKEMRENNQWFSYLYPFSNIYYRKFGYENTLTKTKNTIPLSSFSHFPSTGRVKLYLPGNDYSDIEAIYNSFIAHKNLAIVRDAKLWDKHLGEDPYKNLVYTYIWHDDNGVPKSYVTFKVLSNGPYSSHMEVRELIWLDGESLLGILGFIKGFSPRYVNFIWDTPHFLNLSILFPEPYHVEGTTSVSGMNRIVDLEEVLKLLKCPKGEGQLVFEVFDNFLDWNTGTFVIKWSDEVTEVSRTDAESDLSCSIQAMTQLITGYANIEDFFCHNDFKIHGNYTLLSEFFKKKQLYIVDYF
jgi:predicted acetyltransferase